MKITIGVFAHVDAGKTTFCESLLYQTNEVPSFGRVDHENTLLDFNELEKKRKITIFSGVASFNFNGDKFYLIDTPGHIDFSAEAERAVSILDAAILIVSAPDGVESQTITLYRLLREKRIPTYIFVSKVDQTDNDISYCLEDIKSKLTDNIFTIKGMSDLDDPVVQERLCDFDDALTERFLSGSLKTAFVSERLKALIKNSLIPIIPGCAIRHEGVLSIIEFIAGTLVPASPDTNDFSARAFKIMHDAKGARVTFIKMLSGGLSVKDIVSYGESEEKIHEIRFYKGQSYKTADRAETGDIAGIIGLTGALPGSGLGGLPDTVPVLKPALKAGVLLKNESADSVMSCLKTLNAEDPTLAVSFVQSKKEIEISVMGKIQLEVLQDLIASRFNLFISFDKCRVVYKETVANPVMGYGHFEPLRHYSEVHLRIEPNPGNGITFASELDTDTLPRQYQNLIRHFALSRDHKGVLTGSSLTDVHIVLTKAAIHIKHTDGGDLREATYRAVRQGLEKAENVILEPYYTFIIDVDNGAVGRVMSDLTAMCCEYEPPAASGNRTSVRGRGPVSTLMDYQNRLLSFTKGSGNVSMTFLGYFPCHDPNDVIESIGYLIERDMENTSSSVFCAKGAGYEVKGRDAESHMHLL